MDSFKRNTLLKLASIMALTTTVGTAVTTLDASAATKNRGARTAKVLKDTHYKKATLKKAHPKKAIRIYSSRYLKSYVNSKKTKTFTVTESVKVRKTNGKTQTYRYVKAGSVKGWTYWSNVTGKMGKKTSTTTYKPANNSTAKAPSKIVSKNVVLKKTSTDKSVKGDNTKVYVLKDNVTNASYKGLKHLATYRDKINELGNIVKNHPAAFDAYTQKHLRAKNHAESYEMASQVYKSNVDAYKENLVKGATFVKRLGTNKLIPDYTSNSVVSATKTVQAWINHAKY